MDEELIYESEKEKQVRLKKENKEKKKAMEAASRSLAKLEAERLKKEKKELKLENLKETNKQMTGINEIEKENDKSYKENEMCNKVKENCGDCGDCGFIIKKNTKKITMDKYVKKKKCEINKTEVSTGFPIIKKKK